MDNEGLIAELRAKVPEGWHVDRGIFTGDVIVKEPDCREFCIVTENGNEILVVFGGVKPPNNRKVCSGREDSIKTVVEAAAELASRREVRRLASQKASETREEKRRG